MRRVIALILSILLWAFVRVTQTQEGLSMQSLSQVTVSVPLDIRNVPVNLEEYEISQHEVKVTLRGDISSIEALRDGFVRAYVDLSGVDATNVWPEVKVLPPGGLTLVSVEPRSVNIKLSPKGTRLVPVRVRVNGAPASGMLAREPVLEPRQVKVSGPEAMINEVEEVVGRVVLDGQSQSFSVDLRDLKPVNSQGTEVQTRLATLQLIPSSVSATIPITAESQTVAVPVSLDNIHATAVVGWTYRFEVEPQLVTLRVAREEHRPRYVLTRVESFGATTRVESREVDLLIPDGVEVVGSSSVRVKLIPERPVDATPTPAPTRTPLPPR